MVTAKEEGVVSIIATSTENTTKKAVCTITVVGQKEKRFYGIEGGYAPTGNYSQSFIDITMPSVLGDIMLFRTYNSLEAANASNVGKGFHFNYDMRVVIDSKDASKTYIIMPDSAWWCFIKNADETYTAMECRGTLEKDAVTGQYTFEDLSKMQYGFTSAGYLEYMEDCKGNRITISRDVAGNITKMTDSSDPSESSILSVSFTYSGGLLTEIKDEVSNRTVQYEYNNGELSKVTDAEGIKTNYEYGSGLLTKITASNEDEKGTLTYKNSEMTYYTDEVNGGLLYTITDEQELVSEYDYSEKAFGQVTITDDNSQTIQNYNLNLDITKTAVMPLEEEEEDEDIVSALTIDTFNSYHEVVRTEDICENVTTYVYDDRGNLTCITYPDNGTESYIYDDNNDICEYKDKNNARTFYAYDAYHNLITVTRSLNGSNYVINRYEYYTDNTYPIRSLLKKEIGPLGDDNNCMKYEYSFTPRSEVTKTISTIKCVNGADKVTTSEYDKVGRLVRETTPTGIATVYTYDPNTALLQKKDILDHGQRQQTESYTYNALGEEKTTTITLSDNTIVSETEYEYDKDSGNLIQETSEDGTKTGYQYDSNGNVKTEIEMDKNGNELEAIETTYDELNRSKGEKTIDISDEEEKIVGFTVTTYWFEEHPDSYYTGKKATVTKTIDEFGGETVTITDYDGRLLEQTNPNKLLQINYYNPGDGRLEREEYRDEDNRLLKWTEYVYDIWGRVTKQTDSFHVRGNAEVRYTYDVAGNALTELVKVETNKYKKTAYAYDAWGNRTRTTCYEGFFDESGMALDDKPASHTQTVYDWNGQVLVECKGLTSILSDAELDNLRQDLQQNSQQNLLQNLLADKSYSIIQYQYDNFARLTEKIDARGEEESYQYDHAGRIVKTIDRNLVVHEVTYDKANRVIEEKSGDIQKRYTYGDDGNLQSVSEGQNKIEYKYDSTGRMIEEKTSGNIKKEYSETSVGKGRETLETITVDGTVKQQVKKVYNECGQLTAVYEKDILKTEYTYTLLGQLSTTTNANHTTETREYNMAGLVTAVLNEKDTEVLSRYDYIYNYDGNQCTKIDNKERIEYTYDGCGQLIKTTSALMESTSFVNAAPLTIGNPARISLDEVKQVKYFKFTPSKTGTYVIESMCKGYSDPRVRLYQSDGTLLASDYDSNGIKNARMEYTLHAKEQYIIGAGMYSCSKGSYLLHISEKPVDENTTFEKAETMTLGVPVSVNIQEANEMRYFKFTPDTTAIYTIASMDNRRQSGPYSDGSTHPDVYLYQSDGTLLNWSIFTSNGGFSVTIEYELNAGEQYIIGANIDNSRIGSYTLAISQQFGVGGNDIDNTTFEKAEMITSEVPVSVKINSSEERYFKFVPTETATYMIVGTGLGVNYASPYGSLYALDGTLLASAHGDNSGGNFEIEYKLKAGESYVIDTKMKNSWYGSMNYFFTVTQQSDDIVEQENTQEDIQEYTFDANGNRKTLTETKDGVVTQTTYHYDKNDRLQNETTEGQTSIRYDYDDNGNMTQKTETKEDMENAIVTTHIFDTLNRMTSYQDGNGVTTDYTYYPDNMRKSKGSTTHVWLGMRLPSI